MTLQINSNGFCNYLLVKHWFPNTLLKFNCLIIQSADMNLVLINILILNILLCKYTSYKLYQIPKLVNKYSKFYEVFIYCVIIENRLRNAQLNIRATTLRTANFFFSRKISNIVNLKKKFNMNNDLWISTMLKYKDYNICPEVNVNLFIFRTFFKSLHFNCYVRFKKN